MAVIGVLMHNVCVVVAVADVKAMPALGLTVTVDVAVDEHPLEDVPATV